MTIDRLQTASLAPEFPAQSIERPRCVLLDYSRNRWHRHLSVFNQRAHFDEAFIEKAGRSIGFSRSITASTRRAAGASTGNGVSIEPPPQRRVDHRLERGEEPSRVLIVQCRATTTHLRRTSITSSSPPCIAALMFARLHIVTYGTASSVSAIRRSPRR